MKQEFQINLVDSQTDEVIRQICVKANKAGIEGKTIKDIHLKRMFGEGLKVTFDFVGRNG